MSKIDEQFERRHNNNISRYSKSIEKIYHDAINRISSGYSKSPALLRKQVDSVIADIHTRIVGVIVNGVNSEWQLANLKNNIILDRRLSGRLSNDQKAFLYDPNTDALAAFNARKVKGLNLSQRVWKYINPYRHEIEAGLTIAIQDGKSATGTASLLKKNLREPERLFRRVRDAEGNLQLSRAARNYHPGRGVYRSSYKIALRLTRNEPNIAYREADHLRWMQNPTIVGQEIKLSARHPEYDICDVCAGKYPKSFVFNGWHTSCICYKVPIMMTDAEFEKYEDALLDGKKPSLKSENEITDVPNGFKSFVNDNRSRINGWSNKPYWVRDNFKNGDINKSLRFDTKEQAGNSGSIEKYKKVPTPKIETEVSLIDRLRKMDVQVNDSEAFANVLNKELKNFDFEKLFGDFEKIGKDHGIEWEAKRISVSEHSSRFLITRHIGNTPHGEVYIERNFDRIDGKVSVYHAYFQLPKQLQGSGVSKKVLGSYYEQYVNAGISKVSVTANIDVGGYTWAKYGFSAKDKSQILYGISKNKYKVTPKQYASVVEKVNTFFDKYPNKLFPMRRIADLGKDKSKYGKKLLLGTNWSGVLDLSDVRMKKIFEEYLYGQ